MIRLRLLAACGLAFGLITATIAQEKKEPTPPAKKDQGKSESGAPVAGWTPKR